MATLSRPAQPRLLTPTPVHPDDAPACLTPPQRPQPARAVVEADLAEAERHLAQTKKSIQQLEALKAAL